MELGCLAVAVILTDLREAQEIDKACLWVCLWLGLQR